jgi:hypothetical protein
MKFLFIFIFSLGCISKLQTQEYNSQELENILERIALETSTSPILDDIEQLILNPINISKSTPEELIRIPGISYVLAKNIINFVSINSDAGYETISDSLNLSTEQLYLIKICSYIKTENQVQKSNNFRKTPSSFTYKIRYLPDNPDAPAFINGSYLGSPGSIYNRMTINYSNFSGGFLTNKVNGESSLIEFYSGYLTGNISGVKFIIGDFNIESGMGTILWKTFGMSKGAEVIAPAVQIGSLINPYRSSMNYNYFRGVSAVKEWSSGIGSITTCLWAEQTPRSGNIDTSENIITSINSPLYFRTASEIQKKNVVTEQSTGGILEWKTSNIRIGASSLYINYNEPIQSDSRSAFYGKNGVLMSLYSFLTLSKAIIGSEIARDAQNNLAFKSGVQFESNAFDVAANYRYYSAKFRSPFGYSMGESPVPTNETGLYCGLRWKATQNIRFSTFVDIFRTLSNTYYVPVPVRGLEMFTEADFTLNKSSGLISRIDFENKTDAFTNDAGNKIVYQKLDWNCRLQINQKVNEDFKAAIRFEATAVNFDSKKPDEYGWMGYLDLSSKINIELIRFNVGLRTTYFSTDSYNSAIWQFAPGLSGMMTTTALYGDGINTMLWLNVVQANFTFGAFVLRIFKNHEDSMGSPPLDIIGNTKNDVGFQLGINL